MVVQNCSNCDGSGYDGRKRCMSCDGSGTEVEVEKKPNPIRLIWKCKMCKDVVISYSHIRHDMNYCECGKSAVDLEVGCMRGMGNIKDISRKQFVNNEWKKIEDNDNSISGN